MQDGLHLLPDPNIKKMMKLLQIIFLSVPITAYGSNVTEYLKDREAKAQLPLISLQQRIHSLPEQIPKDQMNAPDTTPELSSNNRLTFTRTYFQLSQPSSTTEHMDYIVDYVPLSKSHVIQLGTWITSMINNGWLLTQPDTPNTIPELKKVPPPYIRGYYRFTR